jgi:hypothetical protein
MRWSHSEGGPEAQCKTVRGRSLPPASNFSQQSGTGRNFITPAIHSRRGAEIPDDLRSAGLIVVIFFAVGVLRSRSADVQDFAKFLAALFGLPALRSVAVNLVF